MNTQNILRRAAAIAMSATLAITAFTAGTPAMAANTEIGADALTKSQTLTVTSASDISGKTLKAVPLAYYASAQTDGTSIIGYTLSDAGHAADVDAALTSAGIDHSTDYDAASPMDWVVQNLLDSKTSPYAGKLRDFLTSLSTRAGISGATDATALAKGADVNTMTASVRPGIYVILDQTQGGKASIPMMTGTGIDGKTQLANGNGQVTLGTVQYKDNETTVTKKIVEGGNEVDSTSAEIGDEVTYRLKTTVPNWTGYDKFQLVLNDTLGTGLTFGAVSKVTVGGNVLDASLYKVEGPTQGKVSVILSPDANGTSDLVANKGSFPVGSDVIVEYTATLNADAVIGTGAGNEGNPNTVDVEYSHNPNDSTDKEKVPGTAVKTYTGRVIIVKRDKGGNKLANAKFTIKGEDGNAVGIVKKADGEYRVALDGETSVTEMETPDSGQLVIDGLSGHYTVTETAAPDGFMGAFLPSFSFTVTPDKDGKNAVEGFTADANQLAVFDGAETIDVTNVKNITELPQTGATGIGLTVGGIVVLLAGALVLLRRRS